MKKYNTKKRLHKKQQLTEILFILFLIILPVAVIGNASVRTLQAYDEDISTAVIQSKNHIVEANKMVVEKELTIKEYVRAEIEKAGLKWEDVDCLVTHESNWNEWNLYDNKNGAGVDRGLYQFSSIWHKEISNKEAFDYKLATKHFIKIVKQDGNYHQWHGYTNFCK